MHDTEANQLIKKALILETNQRTEFLNQLEEGELKQKITFLLNDDVELTQFILKTSHGAKTIALQHIKDLKPGDKINQFIIVKLIAKGGMGSVYLAYDEKLKRNVAIKAIRSEYLKNHATQKRFKQEAQILSQINHPSICQIYDYIDYEDGDLLVLELVDGITLSNIDLNDSEKLDTFIQIASALVAAHNKDVIHRDLKPDNIMRTEERKIKVLDFGIAKSRLADDTLDKDIIDNDNQQLTKMGTMMGTLLYMSPEQAEGKEITKASDIYSLGIIMQEMLTGVTVYDLVNTKGLKEQVIKAEKVNSDLIPKKYRKLIDQLTQRDPKNRPNAETLKQALIEIKQAPNKKKRKLKNIIIGVATFIFACILIYQWYSFSKQQKITILLNDFKNKIQDISLTWDKIYTLPIHDISQDLINLEDTVEQLIETIMETSEFGIIEKNLLKGRTYYAFNQYKTALPYLENSWQSGINEEQLAYELSLSNMIVYYQESKKQHYDEGLVDKGFQQQIEKKYYLPAKKYFEFLSLKDKITSVPKAFLFWHDKKEIEAIAMLKQLRSEQDWQFEIYQFEGEIMQSLSMSYYNKGEVEKAALMWKEITQVFLEASLRGRSFVKAFEEICIVENSRIGYTKELVFGNFEDVYENGIKNCHKALFIKPNNSKITNVIASSHGLYATNQLSNGKNPLQTYKKALEFSHKSIAINKTYRNVSYKSYILLGIAQYKNMIGKDPNEEINNSIEAQIETAVIAPNSEYYTHISIIWALLLKMERLYIIGENPLTTLNKIISHYQKGANLIGKSNPSETTRNTYLALAYGYYAYYQKQAQENPITTVEQVEKYINKSKELTQYNPFNNSILADAYSVLIEYKIQNNQDATKELDKALILIREVIATKESPILNVYGKLLFLQQQNNLIHATIVEQNITQAIDVITQSIALNKTDVKPLDNLAKLYLFQAQHTKSGDKKEMLRLGIEVCDSSIGINPIFAYAYFNKAQLIEYGIKLGIFSQKKHKEAEGFFKKANSLNPLISYFK